MDSSLKWPAMWNVDVFFVVSLNRLLKKVELSVIWDTMALVWRGCRKPSNIRRTLGGNQIVDHSDVVGASPVGAAPTTSSFST